MKRKTQFGTTLIGLMMLLGYSAPAIAQTEVLTVGDEPRQMMRYGLDYERLWFWYGPAVTNPAEIAKWSVVDCNIDYIRTAINSAYELNEGEYDLSAYTRKIIPMMTAMQNAKPDIKWFASPRPLNEAISGARWQPYPRWVTGDDGSGNFNFNWEKCGEYLLRYIELMDSYGFKISYLDITNEWQSYPTGGRLQPSDVLDIRNYLMTHLPEGIEMPKIIAPSAWSFSQGASFVYHANNLGVADGFDIAASHNTGYQGSAQDFADQAIAAGKEVWDTEVHGWKGSSPATEIPTSSQMFTRIRAGFSGLNGWLAIGTTNQGHCYLLNNGTTVTRNVKYYIFQQLANTSNYGHALDINKPAGLTSTVALIRENLLTVWVLNNSSDDVTTQINIGNRSMMDGTVNLIRWHEALPVEGLKDVLTASSSSTFEATINGKSLYCFEVYLESDEDNFPFLQAENFSGMSGVSVQPSEDMEPGEMVEFSDPNNEVSFDLTITRTSTYNVAFRVSSTDAPIQFDVFKDDTLVASIDRIATGDAQNWTTVYAPVSLDGGSTNLTIRANSGGWNMNWIKFEEQLTYVKENLALKNYAWASGVLARSYTANKSVDGNLGSRWESNTADPKWLAVDFESPRPINGVSFAEHGEAITGYEIQYSDDGETWQTAFTGSNPDEDEVYFFPTVTAPMFRFLATGLSADTVSLYELMFYFNPLFGFEQPLPNTGIHNNGLQLTWSGQKGANYSLESTTELGTGAYTTIESGIPGHDLGNSSTVALPEVDTFYRVIIERNN